MNIENDQTPASVAKDTPAKRYEYWSAELKASMKARRKWWKIGDKIVTTYKGGKVASDDNGLSEDGFRLNLFHSNVKTLENMMYGNAPKIDVSRRYQQPDDDVGRVAAEMMERLLNIDVAENGAEIDAVLKSLLQDRLLAGLGCAKVRYEADIQNEQLISESAPTEYHYWGDVLWSWGRNWADLTWVAFRHYLAKDEVIDRWGESAAQDMDFKKQTENTSDEEKSDPDEDSAWERAEVWEIWDKATHKVRWVSMGYKQELQEQDDPLKLSGFWPCPPFLLANPTTSLYTPTPDYVMAQDLYNEIDTLQTRISMITTAVRVAGVYNAAAGNIASLINSEMDNVLIPVENWALFGENGGVAGQIEWMPLSDIVSAMQELIGLRDQTIGLLQQTTGMMDIMRGQLDNQYEGVGQTQEKAKYGSVRIQAIQEEFAQFAGNLMQLKAEVISRHFSPETIVLQSNMRYSPDIDLVPQALELIKNPTEARIRVSIRPESIAMIDYQAVKSERTEYLTALSTFMQSAAGILNTDPSAKPFVLEMLQWGLAGFKGSSEIEGVLDKAIDAAKKQQEQQQQPSEAQVAAEAAANLEQMKQQGEQAKIQAKAQADAFTRNADAQADIATLQATTNGKLTEIAAMAQAKAAEISMALEADLLREQAQAQSNLAQTQATVEGEMQKDVLNHNLSIEDQAVKTRAKMAEILTDAQAAIKIEQSKPKPAATKNGQD